MTTTYSYWTSSEGYNVAISTELLDHLEDLALESVDMTGNCLVGSYTEDKKTCHITGIVSSGSDSQSTPKTLFRGAQGVEEHLVDLWEKTAGTVYYVGDWHSRPSGDSKSSYVDDDTMIQIARDPDAQCSSPVLLVIGTDGDSPQTGVFMFERSVGKTELKPVTTHL